MTASVRSVLLSGHGLCDRASELAVWSPERIAAVGDGTMPAWMALASRYPQIHFTLRQPTTLSRDRYDLLVLFPGSEDEPSVSLAVLAGRATAGGWFVYRPADDRADKRTQVQRQLLAAGYTLRPSLALADGSTVLFAQAAGPAPRFLRQLNVSRDRAT